MIAATAFLSTLIDLCFGSERGWHDILEGGTWQSACWSAVSLAPLNFCPWRRGPGQNMYPTIGSELIFWPVPFRTDFFVRWFFHVGFGTVFKFRDSFIVESLLRKWLLLKSPISPRKLSYHEGSLGAGMYSTESTARRWNFPQLVLGKLTIETYWDPYIFIGQKHGFLVNTHPNFKPNNGDTWQDQAVDLGASARPSTWMDSKGWRDLSQ